MEKIVPHGNQFKIFSGLKTGSEILLILTTVLSIAIAFIEPTSEWFLYKGLIIKINSIIIIGYVIIEIVAYYLFSYAEINKRLDNIDNAFGTNYSGKKSKGYFSNDELKEGFYKLSVNFFENCLFTYNISKKMRIKVIVLNVVLALVFFSTWLWGQKDSALLIVQLILPVVLIQDLIKLITFVNINKKILDNYYEIFSDLKTGNTNNFEAKIIRNILDYETNICWAVIKTDSRIYKKINEGLSTEWEGIKTEYQIARSEKLK